jgi:hypothetical protein
VNLKFSHFYFSIRVFIWWDWGLNSGLHDCKASTLAKVSFDVGRMWENPGSQMNMVRDTVFQTAV